MTRINVDSIALTDPRFGRLAVLLGLADADHARGKVEHLWLACTTRGETQLPVWLVQQIMGERAPEALVSCELARWSVGRGDSSTRRMHISGARERCMWLRRNQEQSSNGGKTRAQNASRVAGRFIQPAAGEPTSAPAPAPALTDQRSELSGKPDPAPPEPERDPVTELAEVAIGEINRLGGRDFDPASKANLKLSRGLVKAKHSAEDVLLVIQSKRAWIADDKMREFFRPATLLGPEKFARYLDEARAGPARSSNGHKRLASNSTDDEPDLSSYPKVT